MISNPLLTPFLKNDKLLMLALDHRGSFEKILGPKQNSSDTLAYLIETKKKIIDCLSPYYSGLLVDLHYGLPALQMSSISQPYLLCIEKTGYDEQDHERTTVLESSVKELVDKGAKGVKILLFFNPHAQSADIQLELAHEVLLDCKKFSMPFFLEIVTYPLPDVSNENLVVKSVESFLQRGVQPDVFKLEYPGSADACIKITKDLGKIPWILLTQGQDYATFKENLMIAAKNGASGFLAGRSIWQEIKDHKDTDLDEFLKTTVVNRFKEICQIILTS